jgi:hypothetical protein
MSTSELILIIRLFIISGLSLYKKYSKMKHSEIDSDKHDQSSSLFKSDSSDDNYEPYSGK